MIQTLWIPPKKEVTLLGRPFLLGMLEKVVYSPPPGINDRTNSFFDVLLVFSSIKPRETIFKRVTASVNIKL